jgi:hypothetical protein
MPLSNYQFQFGSFAFGAGSDFQILSVDGLEGLPELSTQDSDRGYNDGMFSGRDFLRGRQLIFQMLVLAGSGNSAQQNFNLLQTNLLYQQQGTTAMNFKLSPTDSEYLINARVRSVKAMVDPEFTYGFIKVAVNMFCPDPRYYSATATSAAMVPSAALGRTYDRTYNLVYGGGSITNATAIVNNGWTATYPTITITGPVTNPTVGNVTTGQYLTINTGVTNTDTLVIDLDQKTVTLNGVYARNLLTGNSEWFSAPPGTSYFTFTGTNIVVGTTTAVVNYRSAFV